MKRVLILSVIAILMASCIEQVKVLTDDGIIYTISDPDGYSSYADTLVVCNVNMNTQIHSIYKGEIPEGRMYRSSLDSSLVVVTYQKVILLR